jgi:hypothetical protein
LIFIDVMATDVGGTNSLPQEDIKSAKMAAISDNLSFIFCYLPAEFKILPAFSILPYPE